MSLQTNPIVWEPPAPSALLRWPLPHQSPANGWMARGLALIARRQVIAISGLEHVQPARDPFIIALNHSTRAEAVLVPTMLVLHRQGRLVHFLADWNYRLIPGVGMIYRRGETVTVTHKSARPRVLNLLRPFYDYPQSALERARAHLVAGRSLGIFPEGRVHRDPAHLLSGKRGAAFLSLQTGVPVVPAGIRFPDSEPGQPISDHARMTIEIGPPLHPPALGTLTLADLRGWHAVMMTEISRLSGKAWSDKTSFDKTSFEKTWPSTTGEPIDAET